MARRQKHPILDLVKFNVSLAVAFSGFSGYVLYSREFNSKLFWFCLGLLLVICASSALNHIQEHKYDKLMKRTQNRPIPTQKLSLTNAWAIVISLLITGICILLIFFPPIIAIATVFSGIWYNAVYTPLKRITAFAVIPGALVGAIPPFIGWWAAGGEWFATSIISLAAFFFIGQIPHFWLLMHKYRDDYKRGGFPVISEHLTTAQIHRIILFWVAAVITSVMLFSLFSPLSKGLLLILAAYCVLFVIFITKDILLKIQLEFKRNFLMLNLLYLLVMVIIFIDVLMT